MRMHTKLILAALAATTLLVIGATSAAARNLSANERNFELIWDETLGAPKTKLGFINGSAVNVRCRFTLLGRFAASTIKKETLLNQGTINHGEVESCEGGSVEILATFLPFAIRYRSFEGSLPRIRSASLAFIRAGFRVTERNGNLCVWATEENRPAVFTAGNTSESAETRFERTSEPNNITANRAVKIRLFFELLCGFQGEMEIGGIGLIDNLPRNRSINIALI